MIIVGAKGFAKEVLQVLHVDLELTDDQIVFFDNVSIDLPEKLYNRFSIIRTIEEAKEYIESTGDNTFVLGLGNPKLRKKMYDEFVELGAIPKTIISKYADIGSFGVELGTGTAVMSGTRISNDVQVGKGCLIYYNVVLTHDCIVGDFVELSPSVNILGRCEIGNYTSIGAGAVILPDVTLGKNTIIGAGSVVLDDVPDNVTVVGVPGRIIKRI